MNHRLTIAAGVAVVLASVSEWVLIGGAGWLSASIGAVIVVALAGTATRLGPTQAAITATVLAAAACVPLLVDHSVWLKALGVLIIAVCAASGTRLRLISPVAEAVTYLAALLLYLNFVLSHGKSFALLIPTAKSLHHLSVLANQGMIAAKQPPPVQTNGVILLAAASIGLAAIVVDVLAVRINRPAIAGLPLLVIYLAPIATAAKADGPGSIITFLLAATGYLGLLASDGRSRLRGWGRIVTVWHYAGEDERLGGADIRGLAATGRRIGLAAVCAAIVAPLLLPSLNLHRLFNSHSGGVGHSAVGLPAPLVQLSKLLASPTNAHVLSYRSTGANAGEYMQVYVLNYDSAKGVWNLIRPNPSISIGTTALHAPDGLSPSLKISDTTTTVKLGNVSGSGAGFAASIFFLPVPYWPKRLSLGGAWSQSVNTEMIYSGAGDHSNMSYVATSGQIDLTPAEEAAANGAAPPDISGNYLKFKSPVTKQLQAIADKVTKGSTSLFDKAKALEDYFQHGGFKYTLKAVNLPNTPRGLLQFLTTDKRGFCEQFAFAMAVLARLENIPSRIAVGYTSGTEHQGGTWDVTTSDAHAWPELYFSGLGWLRFEPTPGGADGQGSAVQPSYALAGTSGQTGPGGHSGPGSTLPKTKQNNKTSSILPHVRVPGQGDPLPPSSTVPIPKLSSPVPVSQILLTLLVLLLIAATIPGAARGLTRRRRWRSAADDSGLANAAWQEVCADLDDYGISRKASESPRAVARRLGADTNIDEPAREAIGRIATVVERCRYAPTPAAAQGVRSDVARLRRSLARSSSLITRLRARLLPTSTIEPFTHNIREGIGQVTGWVPTTSEN